MHPLLKRILLNGALTAATLAGVGLLLAHFAGMMAPGAVTPAGAGEPNPPVADSLRGTVPLTMAFWGFVFVAACEAVRWRLRGGTPPAAEPAEQQPDDVERLLNELLEQAESKRAAEQQESGVRSQETEGKQQEASAS